MSDAEQIKERPTKAQKFLIGMAAAIVCISLLAVICIAIYLATPLPASQLSRMVTSYLHQEFKVEKLETSGGTLVLKGVRLENPRGFPKGNLATADSVTVSPRWGDILRGRQRYRLVALNGIRINLDKNSKGVWNYSQLQQLLAARKPSGTETYIGELAVKNGAVGVQGQGVQGIALKVYNLSTKGSLDSKLDLVFEDSGHNRYVINGKGRGGADAALDVTLSAPSLSLKNAAAFFKLKNPAPYEQGKGSLQATASLHKGELTASGDLSFTGINVPTADKNYPVEGSVHFAADYSSSADAARLEALTVNINDLMTVNARGNVRNVRGERAFALYMDMQEVDLGTLNVLLPDATRKDLFLGGTLRCDSLHVLGNRSGLKSVVGTLQLRDGALSRERRVVAAGIAGTLGLFRKDDNVLIKGKISQPGRQDDAMLQGLDMPLTVTLSPRLKPVSAAVPSLSARVMGIPVSGRLAYDVANPEPLSASLKVPATALSSAAVNAQLKRFDLHADSGTAAVSVDVSGKGTQDMSGTLNVALADFRGSRGKSPLAAKKGSVVAKFQRGAGHLQAQGDAQFVSAMIGGKGGDAQSHFTVSDKMLYLDGLRASGSGLQLAITRLSGPIPAKETAGAVTRYPLMFDVEGADIRSGQAEAGGVSGRVRGSLNTEGGAKWLDGNADFASGSVKWQGKKIGSAAVNASFNRSGARGEIGGQLLGGKLAGSLASDPFAKETAATFQAALTGAHLATAAGAFSTSGGVNPSGGAVDVHLKGGYSRSQGLYCTFDGKGSGIALTGRGGKTLLSGGRLSLAGAFSGGNLSVREAVLSPGQGVNLRASGEVKQALSAKREGAVTFSLPHCDINSIVDPFVNSLPGFVQEATFKGTLGADGRINFHQGTQLVEGAVTVRNARMEVPSQKLVVADMNGKLPVSFDLSGKAGSRPQEAMEFSRENYPRLLERLRKNTGGGETITIGKISFGAVETGKITINLSAANGVTQITSFNGNLFKGLLIGKGFVRMADKVSYRGDLLVNDISLKTLCSAFGNIQGYISGRVDGVVSLSGEGGAVKDATGFVQLWARQGSGEKMVVSKEFLQRLAKQKLSGFFFRSDRPYDKAEIKAMLQEGDLTFDTLVIQHTNFFRVRDLNVTIMPGQNRIALDHLLDSIKEAAVRGKPTAGAGAEPAAPAEAAPAQEFKWGE